MMTSLLVCRERFRSGCVPTINGTAFGDIGQDLHLRVVLVYKISEERSP